MSIEAGHWGMICASVQNHAEKLYPKDKQKQRELVEELLCITSSETMFHRGMKADTALKRLERQPLRHRLRSWLKQLGL